MLILFTFQQVRLQIVSVVVTSPVFNQDTWRNSGNVRNVCQSLFTWESRNLCGAALSAVGLFCFFVRFCLCALSLSVFCSAMFELLIPNNESTYCVSKHNHPLSNTHRACSSRSSMRTNGQCRYCHLWF